MVFATQDVPCNSYNSHNGSQRRKHQCTFLHRHLFKTLSSSNLTYSPLCLPVSLHPLCLPKACRCQGLPARCSLLYSTPYQPPSCPPSILDFDTFAPAYSPHFQDNDPFLHLQQMQADSLIYSPYSPHSPAVGEYTLKPPPNVRFPSRAAALCLASSPTIAPTRGSLFKLLSQWRSSLTSSAPQITMTLAVPPTPPPMPF